MLSKIREEAGRWQMFLKIGALKTLADFTNKTLYPVFESLFNKVAGLNRSETLL